MKRYRRGGFTLLELMAVVVIIFVLAGLMMAGIPKVKEGVRRKRTEAILDVLATACEDYWTIYHDYPYPNPDYLGSGGTTLGSITAFRDAYYSGGWTNEGYNVAFVWLMSKPRHPEPLLSLNQEWFKKTDEDLTGPDGRKLFKVEDGFHNVIKVERPAQYYYVNTYIKLISAGADGDLGTTEDNVERYIKR